MAYLDRRAHSLLTANKSITIAAAATSSNPTNNNNRIVACKAASSIGETFQIVIAEIHAVLRVATSGDTSAFGYIMFTSGNQGSTAILSYPRVDSASGGIIQFPGPTTASYTNLEWQQVDASNVPIVSTDLHVGAVIPAALGFDITWDISIHYYYRRRTQTSGA